MNSYIVRIYRREQNKPGKLVGIVEEVGVEGTCGFTDMEELWDILNRQPRSKKSIFQKPKKSADSQERGGTS